VLTSLPKPDGRRTGRASKRRQGRGKPVYVMVGISRERTFRMMAHLVAAWLAERFGCPFVEIRTGDDSNLAVEVFYDELDRLFRDKAMIGVIGLGGETAAEILSGSGSLASLPETGPIVFKRQGQARAFLNDESGRTQVTFDHLPGALEFVSEPSAKASAPAILTPHAELVTWYGFGEVEAGQQEIAEEIAKRRNVVRRGIVNLDLKIELA
jgi:hypothetical protein